MQRNQFRIRVAEVTVQANRLGATSARNAAISRLRDNPGDRAAARSLAEDVARAASRDLVVDLTAQVTRDLGHPQIDRWSGEFRNLTGRQVGGPNRARVTVHVTVSKLESRALERQILKSAELRARQVARDDRPTVPPAGDLNRIHRFGPTRLPGPGGDEGSGSRGSSSVEGPWPLVSLLSIAAISRSGQVLSRPSSRDAMKERASAPGGCWKLQSIRLHQGTGGPR